VRKNRVLDRRSFRQGSTPWNSGEQSVLRKESAPNRMDGIGSAERTGDRAIRFLEQAGPCSIGNLSEVVAA